VHRQLACLFLSNLLSILGAECLCVTLHVIQQVKEFKPLSGNQAAVIGMQLKQLSAGMGHAVGLRDTFDKQRLIGNVIIANQRAAPTCVLIGFTQECSGMFAGTGLTEVVHHRMGSLEDSRCISP